MSSIFFAEGLCKVFITFFVRIADYAENTEDAEGVLGGLRVCD